jgi:hypothetical protein
MVLPSIWSHPQLMRKRALSLSLLTVGLSLSHLAHARLYHRDINIITSNYDLVDTTYIDRGRLNGVKVGDKFEVKFPDGKLATQVVVTGVFERMASVKIVDSWLLKDGQTGNFHQRPMVVAMGRNERRPAPDIKVGAKAKAASAAAAPTAVASSPAAPASPAPAAPAAAPAVPDAGGLPSTPDGLPAGPGLPATPGLPPAPDAGLPPAPGAAPDAGLPPAPDAGLPPAPGAAPDAGLPPAPDAGLPPAPGAAPDAGLPPAPDAGLPPAAPDAGLPPAPAAGPPPGDPGLPPPL